MFSKGRFLGDVFSRGVFWGTFSGAFSGAFSRAFSGARAEGFLLGSN
jgi:hypothetical protein